MERIGDREYRCNHCGAITVVSQEQANRGATSSPVATSVSQTPRRADPSSAYTAGQKKSSSRFVFPLLVLLAIFGSWGYHSLQDVFSSQGGSSSAGETNAIPAKTLAISSFSWSNDTNPDVSSGKYFATISNKSGVPVEVPRYTMTLYSNGVRDLATTSIVPLSRLLPGEYEPISFAFSKPEDSPHIEVNGADTVDQASGSTLRLPLLNQQLVRERDKPGYRLVGIVQNNSSQPASSINVLVMLFDTDHKLLAYGNSYTRTLRPGEKSLVDVNIPTQNYTTIGSYEYIVDAHPETSQL
jgi:hypothetical protein